MTRLSFLLKEHPDGVSPDLVVGVLAPDEIKSGGGRFKISGSKPMGGGRPVAGEQVGVKEPVSVWGEYLIQTVQIIPLFFMQVVKTSQIEGEVEGAFYPAKFADILPFELDFHICGPGFAACFLEGEMRDVNPNHMPAVLCQRNGIGTCATAEVDGAPDGMLLDEFE